LKSDDATHIAAHSIDLLVDANLPEHIRGQRSFDWDSDRHVGRGNHSKRLGRADEEMTRVEPNTAMSVGMSKPRVANGT
jgi:hypothetical protein